MCQDASTGCRLCVAVPGSLSGCACRWSVPACPGIDSVVPSTLGNWGVAMPSSSRRIRGFTLIELMITLAVIVVIMLLALPSFASFQHRSALRGSSEQALGFWNQARFEAAKRNQMVKVGVKVSGSQFCLGATTTTVDDPDNDEPCNCFTVGACNVTIFPADPANNQAEWRGVTVSGTPTLGTNTGVAVIEPKRTALTATTMAGAISFAGPIGRRNYRVNLLVDRFGRAVLCGSNSAPDTMSDYTNRKCGP